MEKSKKVFEIFRVIKEGRATSRRDLVEALLSFDGKRIQDIYYKQEKSFVRTIANYINELKNVWEVDIRYDKKSKRYVIENDGLLGNIEFVNPFTDLESNIVLTSFLKSSDLFCIDLKVLQNKLIKLSKKRMHKHYYSSNTHNQNSFNDSKLELYNKINSCILNNNKILIVYQQQDKVINTYELCPYGVIYENNVLYLIAEDASHLIKNFNIFNIYEVTELKDSFIFPKDFNLKQYLKRSFYMTTGELVCVKLKFSEKLRYIEKELHLYDCNLVEDIRGNYFIYEFNAYGLEGIKRWILSLGCEVQIISPIDLKKLLIDEVCKIQRNYKKEGF